MRRVPILLSLALAGLILTGAVAWAVTRTVETTAAVDVTVWKHATTDAIYLSTRPADGTWTTHNTPVDLSTLHSGGNFYQGSAIRVDVPVTVEVEEPAHPAQRCGRGCARDNTDHWPHYEQLYANLSQSGPLRGYDDGL